jgi:tRNA G46 methylase TrmB
MIHNPYVDLVSQHPRILTEHEKIYAHKGTWATFFDNKNPIVLEIGS